METVSYFILLAHKCLQIYETAATPEHLREEVRNLDTSYHEQTPCRSFRFSEALDKVTFIGGE